MSEPSLRERKKRRTREVVIAVSRRLFDEQGYDLTTLEQICDEAEISVPTLLAYFESKDRLALASEYDSLDTFRAVIGDPHRVETTLALWRGHVERGARSAAKHRRVFLRHLAFVDSSPALGRGTLALLQGYEDVLAEGLAHDFGTDPESDLATRLMATTLSFGNQTALSSWYARGGRGDLAEAVLGVVDFVIERFPRPGAAVNGT